MAASNSPFQRRYPPEMPRVASASAPSPGAYYREFVQLERLKKNGQFGAKRTVVSV
jgi:hypothetical protein